LAPEEGSAAVRAAVEAENRFTKLEVTASAILDKVSELADHVAAQNGRLGKLEVTALAREPQYNKIGVIEADVLDLKNKDLFSEGVQTGKFQLRTSDKAYFGAFFIVVQIILTAASKFLL
jgi:hypothetical protein